MTTITERITQFENMAEADPDNDMAHFSLGNAYLKAYRHSDAARSLQRCIELNDQMSKAYQLAGQALDLYHQITKLALENERRNLD